MTSCRQLKVAAGPPNNFASVSYSKTQSPDFPNPGRQIYEYSFFPLKLLSGSNWRNISQWNYNGRKWMKLVKVG